MTRDETALPVPEHTIALSKDAKWYVRPTDESVYGRREGELYLRSRSGQLVDVAEWFRANGYERAAE